MEYAAKTLSNGQSALDVIDTGAVDLVINIPRTYDAQRRPDGYLIRRSAVDAGVPLITDLQLARAVIEALLQKPPGSLRVCAWNDYLERTSVRGRACVAGAGRKDDVGANRD